MLTNSKKKITRKEFLTLGFTGAIAVLGGMVLVQPLKDLAKENKTKDIKLNPETAALIKRYSMGWWQNVDGKDIEEDLKKLGLKED